MNQYILIRPLCVQTYIDVSHFLYKRRKKSALLFFQRSGYHFFYLFGSLWKTSTKCSNPVLQVQLTSPFPKRILSRMCQLSTGAGSVIEYVAAAPSVTPFLPPHPPSPPPPAAKSVSCVRFMLQPVHPQLGRAADLNVSRPTITVASSLAGGRRGVWRRRQVRQLRVLSRWHFSHRHIRPCPILTPRNPAAPPATFEL